MADDDRPWPARRRPPARTALAARLLSLLLLAGACAAPPPRPFAPVRQRPPSVDVLDYEITLRLHEQAGYVEGSVAIEFAALPGPPTRQLRLHAVDLAVRSARDSRGRELAVDDEGDELLVHLAEPLPAGVAETVTLAYDAFPARGIHFIRPEHGRPWHVWTQGQSEDTRHWMPVWDIPNDRATTTLHLEVDDALMTLGAGTLVDSWRNEQTGRRTDTWRIDVPHTSYLTTFVAGGLAQADVGAGGLPLPVLADPADLPTALENAADTARIVAFLEELTGLAYPYPKYAQTFVHDYTAGGMENISATTLYYEGLHDPSDRPQMKIVDLLVHEAAHQWFGDLIGSDGWTDLWVQEGFADFTELLWLEREQGAGAAAAERQARQRDAMAAPARPIVWRGWRHPDELFDDHVYQGASVRLHLLRQQLGEDAFTAGVRRLVAAHAGRLVTTGDVRAAFEQASGADLRGFFQQWFDEPGFPRLRAGVLAPSGAGGHPVLRVRQVQGDTDGWRDVFVATVDVAWSRGGVEHRAALRLDAREVSLPLTGEGPLRWVSVDDGGDLPGEVKVEQPEAAWVAQLGEAGSPSARLVAAQWLAGDTWVREAAAGPRSLSAAAVDGLLAAAAGDPLVDVRLTALGALAECTDARLLALAKELAGDGDARLRAAALPHLARLAGASAADLLLAATDDANGYVVHAALVSLLQLGWPGALDTALAIATSTPKVRLARDLVVLLAPHEDARVLPFLVAMARGHRERWVRAAAVAELGAWRGAHGDAVLRQLAASLGESSYHVRAAAATALGRRGGEDAALLLAARRRVEVDSTVLHAIDGALARLR